MLKSKSLLWPEKEMAERGGFEPPVPFGTPAFQASTFGRSVTSPQNRESTLKCAFL